MSEKKKLYVIKLSNGSYHTEFNGASRELRFAKIYVSLKYLKEAVKRNRYEDYKVIEVDIKEVGEVYGN